MKILTASPENIALAAEALRAGDLVAVPTETVYGLAADAANDLAVQKIYDAKARPAHNPLIIHLPDAESAMRYGAFNDHARAFASVFWPGPLTLVVKKSSGQISSTALNNLETIALRVPSHPVMQQLLKISGRPLAAPSANRSGRLSPTQANHVADDFTDADQPKIILAGGRSETGLESTIVDCSGASPRILRPGSITIEELRAVIPETESFASQKAEDVAIITPGMLEKHYAPQTPMRLNVAEIFEGEALLAFGTEPLWTRRAVQMLNLSPASDMTEAAHNLFSHLHQLDQAQAKRIAVMPIPNEGIGIAINDRLRRGAIR